MMSASRMEDPLWRLLAPPHRWPRSTDQKKVRFSFDIFQQHEFMRIRCFSNSWSNNFNDFWRIWCQSLTTFSKFVYRLSIAKGQKIFLYRSMSTSPKKTSSNMSMRRKLSLTTTSRSSLRSPSCQSSISHVGLCQTHAPARETISG